MHTIFLSYFPLNYPTLIFPNIYATSVVFTNFNVPISGTLWTLTSNLQSQDPKLSPLPRDPLLAARLRPSSRRGKCLDMNSSFIFHFCCFFSCCFAQCISFVARDTFVFVYILLIFLFSIIGTEQERTGGSSPSSDSKRRACRNKKCSSIFLLFVGIGYLGSFIYILHTASRF